MKLSELVAYPAHVLWLSITERRQSYLSEHRYTLLRFLPSEVAELEGESRDLEVVNESVLLYGLTTSDLFPLEDFTPQMSWRDARKEGIMLLGEAMFF